MKKILMVSVCFMVSAALAQGLFPELNAVYGENANENAAVTAPVSANEEERDLPSIAEDDAEVIQDDGEIEESDTAADLFETPDDEEEEVVSTEEVVEEETPAEEEQEEQNIIIYPSEINATLVPNNNFSYCMGKMKFMSTMKRPVKRLKVTLNYGELSADYDIRNLTNKETKTKELILVGTSCEHVMDTPQIDIKECSVEGMTVKACKEKVIFSPMQ